MSTRACVCVCGCVCGCVCLFVCAHLCACVIDDTEDYTQLTYLVSGAYWTADATNPL